MPKIEKLDLYKKHKAQYVTPKEPVFVKIGPAKYLTFAGTGAPSGARFAEGVAALYTVAYTLKMAEKFEGRDYKVCHLEGQWWTDEDAHFATETPEQWHWRLLIRVPEFVNEKKVWLAIETAIGKGKAAAAREVTLEKLEEGQCVQVLHLGPFATERSTIEKMDKLSAQKGLRFRGPHHEIYLSDPRRVPQERLRTILRHPLQ